jgi:Polyketide cyclase / dehydrase and lipid transport
VVRIEASQRFDAPLEQGFAYITDLRNWPRFWPGFVSLDSTSRWGQAGDIARLVTRLLGRDVELTMKVERFERNELVTYKSTQPGLPDAYHERHFGRDGDGFVYGLVVEYEPRSGVHGLLDRSLLKLGIRRAFRRTFADLARELEAPAA